MVKATIKLALEGKPLSNGKYTVYLQVIKDRKRKRISLGLTCQKENFVNELFTKKHKNYQIENEMLLRIKTRALEIIRDFQNQNNDFTLNEFEEKFRGKKKSSNVKIIDFFDEIVDEEIRKGKISNAKAYRDTKNSIVKFKGKRLTFQDITPTFLEKYEVWLRENGNKNGGVKFKMRELKALFNKARKRGVIPNELYPFKDYKFSHLKSEAKKEFLSVEEFKKIKDLDLSKYPNLLDTYRYFMFSICTRGMNFKDMMHLKWSDIQNGRIYYVRSKTKGKLNLEIIPYVQEILDFYKAQNRPTNYVFPILLSEDLTPQQVFNRRHKVISRYNRQLKEIAKLAEINKRLTTYVGRRSFATILKMTGTPIEKITEMMGHSDVSVTIAYLKEFSNEDLDKENRKFMDL